MIPIATDAQFMRLPNGIILDSDISGGMNRAIKNPHFRGLKNVIRFARIVIRKESGLSCIRGFAGRDS